MKYKKEIIGYLTEERNVIENLNVDEMNAVLGLLDDCLDNGRTVYVFGNGGSGSTASHMANDFNKAIFKKTDKRFNFSCLNDNLPSVLAISNDEGYDEIFRHQLYGRLTKDDVIIAISGSGNSKNIINACEYAKEIGATIVGFTGYDGGKLKKMADYSINARVDNMQISEDIHLILEHMMISIFYDKYNLKDYKKVLTRKSSD